MRSLATISIPVTIAIGLGAASLLGTILPVHAQSLRCGGQLVRAGDHQAEVARACGQPDFIDRWVGSNGLVLGPPMVQWTYNNGPGQLIEQVMFRGGQVIDVSSAGYGFADHGVPPSGSCEPNGIQPGLSKYRLLRACGPPAEQTGWFVFAKRARDPGFDYDLGDNRGALVYRERWLYNFGANRLTREVMLDDAVVTGVKLGNRGFDR